MIKLTFVAQVDVKEMGERVSLVVYAGNDFDSAISSIHRAYKEHRGNITAFNIQVWQDGKQVWLNEEVK